MQRPRLSENGKQYLQMPECFQERRSRLQDPDGQMSDGAFKQTSESLQDRKPLPNCPPSIENSIPHSNPHSGTFSVQISALTQTLFGFTLLLSTLPKTHSYLPLCLP